MSLSPTIYLASPLKHHTMWREWKRELSPSTINIVSTWHDDPNIETLELDAEQCVRGWNDNRAQIYIADHILVFAMREDLPNGTLVEIGMALGDNEGTHIHLVGDYPWGSWRFLDEVQLHETLHEALCAITGVELHLPVKEHLDHDPS